MTIKTADGDVIVQRLVADDKVVVLLSGDHDEVFFLKPDDARAVAAALVEAAGGDRVRPLLHGVSCPCGCAGEEGK